MPTFSNAPPSEGRGPAFSVRRTPANRPLVAVITSDDLLGCATHFFGGRTIPCETPNCAACLEQVPWRWHGYVAALELSTHEHFIFETTAQATDPLVAYRTRHSTLRGCKFEASRAHNRPNGRVIIRCKPCDLQSTHLPVAPDITKILSLLWNTRQSDVSIRRKPGPFPPEEDDNHPIDNEEPSRIGDLLKFKGNSPPKQPPIH